MDGKYRERGAKSLIHKSHLGGWSCRYGN